MGGWGQVEGQSLEHKPQGHPDPDSDAGLLFLTSWVTATATSLL